MKFPACYHAAARHLVRRGAYSPSDECRVNIAAALRWARKHGGRRYAKSIRGGLRFISGHFPGKE